MDPLVQYIMRKYGMSQDAATRYVARAREKRAQNPEFDQGFDKHPAPAAPDDRAGMMRDKFYMNDEQTRLAHLQAKQGDPQADKKLYELFLQRRNLIDEMDQYTRPAPKPDSGDLGPPQARGLISGFNGFSMNPREK